MKLGLMTAAFPGKTIEEVAGWAAENGFDALEIACWPVGKADRRYAGVTTIDAAALTPPRAREIRSLLDDHHLTISSLGYYPNPLSPDLEHRTGVIEHLKKVITAAELLEVPVVGTFIGKNKDLTAAANLQEYARVWPPIVRFAGEHGVKIAIENCPMIFSDDEWPGGNNLASTPAIWRQMWEIIPDENFGLNLDPSHLIWLMIDYVRVVHEFKDRIFHVHAKDVRLERDGLYNHGVMAPPLKWHTPVLPGFGDVNWSKFIGALWAVGYDGTVSIEHEDRAFEKAEDLVKRGFLIARDVLRPYLR
jgi:sugar phosphate isomerase/epimerase